MNNGSNRMYATTGVAEQAADLSYRAKAAAAQMSDGRAGEAAAISLPGLSLVQQEAWDERQALLRAMSDAQDAAIFARIIAALG